MVAPQQLLALGEAVKQSSAEFDPGFAAGGATARGAVVAAAGRTTAETDVCESLRRESTARQRTDHIDTRAVGALVVILAAWAAGVGL